MEFVVIDAETGESIPNAAIDVMAEDHTNRVSGQRTIKLLTDNEGRARFVRENNS